MTTSPVVATEVLTELCAHAGLPAPVSRTPIRIWELSGVERVTLANEQTVIMKYARPPFCDEAHRLRAAANAGLPVPMVLAATDSDNALIMLLDDLGDPTGVASDDDGAHAAALFHNAALDRTGLDVLDRAGLAKLPNDAIAMLDQLDAHQGLAGCRWLTAALAPLADASQRLAEGAEIPPFGPVHGELHETSIHVSQRGLHMVDLAMVHVGPGLLDLATWQGTTGTGDIARLETQMQTYVAAGGTPHIQRPRGGTPAARWALGWHRLWSAAWLLRRLQDGTWPSATYPPAPILNRQVRAAAVLLQP